MNNMVIVLNSLIMIGIVVSAIMAVRLEKLLPSIISLGVTGSFAAFEFLMLQAPDVAIAEASVGAVLTPVIFIVALKRVKEGKKK